MLGRSAYLKAALTVSQRRLVELNVELPKKLYWARFHHQACGLVLGEEECISVGNLALVKASRDWWAKGEFKDYAASAIMYAVNHEADRIRRQRRDEEPLTVEPVSFSHGTFEMEWEDLLVVIHRLPMTDQVLLADKLLSDLTFQEMAHRMGVSKTQVQRLYSIAIHRAKQIVEQC